MKDPVLIHQTSVDACDRLGCNDPIGTCDACPRTQWYAKTSRECVTIGRRTTPELVQCIPATTAATYFMRRDAFLTKFTRERP